MLIVLAGASPLLAAGGLQGLGNAVVAAAVLGMVAYGAQQGLFLAVLAGMHALVSLVVSLAFASRLADVLVSFEMPAAYSYPAAFGILLVGTAVAIRLAVGGYVPRDVVKLQPNVDKFGGGLVGAVAGIVLAGIALIALSIAPLPESLRIDGWRLSYDMGTRMLRTFARCVEPDEAKRDVLLDGEPSSEAAPPLPPPAPPPVAEPPSPAIADGDQEQADEDAKDDAKEDAAPTSAAKRRRRGKKSDAPPPPPPPPLEPAWSEPFVDTNGNKQREDDEPYLDTDGDGSFTARLKASDKNGNGRREIGLLEMYRLHAWGPKVMASIDIGDVSPPADPAPTPAPAP
jgi:hypothetical protein